MPALLAGPHFAFTDLVDQLFNSTEERLARLILLMAKFGQEGQPELVIESSVRRSYIIGTTGADIIGTTRSRVSFFMNKFS
jgi:CRP/FNR family cyclic AMP-dependent transcriptional regulator